MAWCTASGTVHTMQTAVLASDSRSRPKPSIRGAALAALALVPNTFDPPPTPFSNHLSQCNIACNFSANSVDFGAERSPKSARRLLKPLTQRSRQHKYKYYGGFIVTTCAIHFHCALISPRGSDPAFPYSMILLLCHIPIPYPTASATVSLACPECSKSSSTQTMLCPRRLAMGRQRTSHSRTAFVCQRRQRRWRRV